MSLSVDIRKRLGDFSLDVSFKAENPAETLALLGASGCGKSMALKCVAGVERPDEGRIVLNGRVLYDSAARVNVPAQRRRVGYLFQSYALFPAMTVLDNVLVGARGATRAERLAMAARQIRAFRLEGLEGRRPAELSGGQQQRCALARIMASEPELLLLDEPFSALDGYLRWQLELELADTLRAFPGGVVFVTHSRDEVYRMCDRVCVLTDGRGGRTVPTSELFDAPATLAEALISGCKNVSPAVPVGPETLDCADWGVRLACGRAVAGCAHAGIRAHFLRIVEADGRPVDTIGDVATGFGSERGQGEQCAASRSRVVVRSRAENRIPCTVARVIDNVFSTIVMCATPGGACLRVELGKDAWAALGCPARVTLQVAPSDVMPLVD
ncbi:sulfate/molybdate ABC transporter ATP-binding protein [Parolsenella catena]|uniref:sulfate/molybdate ABC transporter ATP-binding protein n=1 Tax=Parolsenella catena TaxID=2003188 RepID=UPI002E783848|nr:ATP-binding cassette domain-containing protein [Parolsenella catena]